MLPACVGLIPFGLVCGVGAAAAGASVWGALGMSAIIFSGAAQIIAAQLLAAGAPVAVIVLTCVVVGPALPDVQRGDRAVPASRCRRGWQQALAFLLTDQVFAAAIRRFDAGARSARRRRCISWAPASRCGSCWQIDERRRLLRRQPRCRRRGRSSSRCRCASSRWIAPHFGSRRRSCAASLAGVAVLALDAPADAAQPDRRRRARHRRRARSTELARERWTPTLKLWVGDPRRRRAQLPVAAVVHRVLRAPQRCRRCSARALRYVPAAMLTALIVPMVVPRTADRRCRALPTPKMLAALVAGGRRVVSRTAR